mmetsp:Transcript_38430/g.85594  ORF Transcript_38430/g.85594 Transcript_38430/m.85594 type:complete len:274 (+) Transcript_38430:493-1314(+)
MCLKPVSCGATRGSAGLLAWPPSMHPPAHPAQSHLNARLRYCFCSLKVTPAWRFAGRDGGFCTTASPLACCCPGCAACSVCRLIAAGPLCAAAAGDVAATSPASMPSHSPSSPVSSISASSSAVLCSGVDAASIRCAEESIAADSSTSISLEPSCAGAAATESVHAGPPSIATSVLVGALLPSALLRCTTTRLRFSGGACPSASNPLAPDPDAAADTPSGVGSCVALPSAAASSRSLLRPLPPGASSMAVLACSCCCCSSAVAGCAAAASAGC